VPVTSTTRLLPAMRFVPALSEIFSAGGDVNLKGGTFSAAFANSEGNVDISAGNQALADRESFRIPDLFFVRVERLDYPLALRLLRQGRRCRGSV